MDVLYETTSMIKLTIPRPAIAAVMELCKPSDERKFDNITFRMFAWEVNRLYPRLQAVMQRLNARLANTKQKKRATTLSATLTLTYAQLLCIETACKYQPGPQAHIINQHILQPAYKAITL